MIPPRIALIGYGKMGREIELVAQEKGIPVTAIIDVVNAPVHSINSGVLENADVCIDFTTPAAVLENIRACATAKKHVVVGTTGWHEHVDTVRSIVEERGIGCIYASNFSIGVHLFLKLVQHAATLFDRFEQYDASVHETHHRMKKDAPSGTALTIAQALLDSLKRKQNIITESRNDAPPEDALMVTSNRVGNVPGTHQVIFDSVADSIELTHTARNRRGFAEGALLAASWIHKRTGFYSIEDMLHEI